VLDRGRARRPARTRQRFALPEARARSPLENGGRDGYVLPRTGWRNVQTDPARLAGSGHATNRRSGDLRARATTRSFPSLHLAHQHRQQTSPSGINSWGRPIVRSLTRVTSYTRNPLLCLTSSQITRWVAQSSAPVLAWRRRTGRLPKAAETDAVDDRVVICLSMPPDRSGRRSARFRELNPARRRCAVGAQRVRQSSAKA